MLSDIIHARNGYDDITHRLALGTIGKVASEFNSFIALYSKLPSIQAILKDPKNADMPSDVGSQYALSGVLAQAITENIDTPSKVTDLMVYLERMQAEMQCVAVAGAFRKSRKSLTNPDMHNWVTNNRPLLTGVL